MSSAAEPRRGMCAIVTGAAGGIGTAVCRRLSEEGVAVLGLDLRERTPETRVESYLQVDLGAVANSAEETDELVRAITSWLDGRPLRMLVNNAAVQCLGPAGTLSREVWRQSLDVNLLAPFFLFQALLPQLEAARGTVVNISSIHARATKPGFVAYATTKAALSGLTRALSVDMGKRVAVCAIEPAAVETELLRQGFAHSPAALETLAGYHPSGEIAQPEHVAELIHFLFSSRLVALQGSCIELGGGISGRLHDPF